MALEAQGKIAGLISGKGEPLVLLPSRAALWGEMLLVADLHLGKESTFRRKGIPLPEGSTSATLWSLTQVVAAARPRVLALLGDIWHSPGDLTPGFCGRVREWRETLDVEELVWVRGNHDRGGADMSDVLRGREAAPGTVVEGVCLFHEPPQDWPAPWAAGHIHPKFSLAKGRRKESAACFWVRPPGVVLPAFGELTGGASIELSPGEEGWLAVGREVFGPIRPSKG